MKITKLGHACLLVEMPDRTALFDPGVMSDVNVASLEYLDDVIVTHSHGDHMNIDLLKKLIESFPDVRITASSGVKHILGEQGMKGNILRDAFDGISVFDAVHEPVEPLFPMLDNIGVHYLDKLTVPGDSYAFGESKEILALPVAAPWGSSVDAVNLAIKLKPKYVIPIHDWHWSAEARYSMYNRMEDVLADHDIEFIKAENGRAFKLDV